MHLAVHISETSPFHFGLALSSSSSLDTARSAQQRRTGDSIRSLEALLQNHIEAPSTTSRYQNSSAGPMSAPSTSSTAASTSDQYNQLPLESLPPSPESLISGPYTTGTLDVSENGYVRYEPRSSQWTSVLTNPSIQASLKGETAILNEEAGCFPFTDSPPIGRRELLGILPLIRYCDQLTDVYFSVFSPVQTPRHFSTLNSHRIC